MDPNSALAQESERRRDPRKEVSLDVHVIGSVKKQEVVLETTIKDLSQRGMAIATKGYELVPGKVILVCLSPKVNECTLKRLIHARVAYCDGYIAGLEFESIGTEAMEFLQVLLKDVRFFGNRQRN